MRSPIHPEGFYYIFFLSCLAFLSSRVSRFFFWMFSILAAFTAYFFRDPERIIPPQDGVIVSPADGTILGIDTLNQVPFLDSSCQRISIFLSIFNVHINRSPIEGKVVFRHYNVGKFNPAMDSSASTENEQNSIVIEDNGYKVLVKQIAGIIARRIICWANPGSELKRGERFGMIRFGSRTEIFLPLNTKIEIKVGDTVKGGETIIARRK